MTPVEKAGAVIAANPELERAMHEGLADILRSRMNGGDKYLALRQLADDVYKAVEPYTPCRSGCSHCCEQAVAITEREAKIIGEHLGVKPVNVPWSVPNAEVLRSQYSGTPCVFLVHGQCAIYKVRPLVCRKHHSLMDSPDACDMKVNPGGKVAALDTRNLDNAMAFLELRFPCADIREFFPAEAIGASSNNTNQQTGENR